MHEKLCIHLRPGGPCSGKCGPKEFPWGLAKVALWPKGTQHQALHLQKQPTPSHLQPEPWLHFGPYWQAGSLQATTGGGQRA